MMLREISFLITPSQLNTYNIAVYGISRQLCDFDLLRSKKNEELQKQLEHRKEEMELLKVTTCQYLQEDLMASASCNKEKVRATCNEQKPNQI